MSEIALDGFACWNTVMIYSIATPEWQTSTEENRRVTDDYTYE
jgi:hypothetical protein